MKRLVWATLAMGAVAAQAHEGMWMPQQLPQVAKDLKAAGKEALVAAGRRQSPVVHALVHQINGVLGASGTTVTYSASARPDRVDGGVEGLRALVGAMNAGQVSTLIVLGGNPVYTAPADLQFGSAMTKVANSIHLGLHANETAESAKWHLPEAHYLETWGDARTTSGVPAIQQPMIEPLYGGKSAIELVAQLLGQDAKGYTLVKSYWAGQLPAAGKDAAWRTALNDGVVAGITAATVSPSINAAAISSAVAAAPAAGTGIEVAFVPSFAAWDGRFTNNGWLQELPDPVTKLVWENAVIVSPAASR